MSERSRWTTLHLRVTTPLFNAGQDQAGSGVRVPSLRGAMRFWFRALAGTVAGRDLALLAALEEAVFGSTRIPSPVRMRIRSQPNVTRESEPRFIQGPGQGTTGRQRPAVPGRPTRDDGKWITYLLGQGLADAASRTLRRDFVEPGKKVSVDFGLSGHEAVDTLALASLWLLCAYGGLGSRTRRGFGGLAITGSAGELPGDWTPESILTPSLEHFEGLTCLWPADRITLWQYCLTDLPDVSATAPDGDEAWTSRPSYPVLSRRWTRAALRPGNTEADWTRVLGYAGEQYRWFRAQDDTPGVPYRPQIKTPEWKNVTGRGDDRFALGALGLPIVFKREGPTVHADQGSGPKPTKLRRASPLWLRPVAGSDQRWKLFSFAFQGDFLPDDVTVHVWPNNTGAGREMTVTSEDLAVRTDTWIEAMRTGSSFIRDRALQ